MADSSGSSSSRQFSLRHIKHETKLNNTLYSMLLDQNLVDVILCCESTNLSAHRLILSANSSYFKSLFISLDSNRCQIPIIILKDVPLFDLKAILEFMYKGEVCVEENRLSSVLKSAELLKVFGLTEVCLALRSRINRETTAAESSAATPVINSGPTSNKRPRINEGIEQTPQKAQQPTQKSPNDLLSKLSNARFEIRPPISTISSGNQTNPQQLRSIIGMTTNTSNVTTLVKNVILPTSQIHRKSHPIEVLPKSTNTTPVFTTVRSTVGATVGTPVGPIVQPSEANTYSKSSNTFSAPSGQRSTDLANSETTAVASRSPSGESTRSSSLSWTPSSKQIATSPVPSSSSIDLKSPVEVLIDDETNDITYDDIVTDVKPPIFELNQIVNKDKNMSVFDIDSDSDYIKETSKDQLTTIGPKTAETLKTDAKSVSRFTIQSRNSSTSSQSSLPPPPGYRMVQRSSSRLLRNMIKPTAAASSATSKRKESSEDRNLNIKKERPSVRVQQLTDKRQTLLNDSSDEAGPEIECPSCGLKFTDERKWDQHIRSEHLHHHT